MAEKQIKNVLIMFYPKINTVAYVSDKWQKICFKDTPVHTASY